MLPLLLAYKNFHCCALYGILCFGTLYRIEIRGLGNNYLLKLEKQYFLYVYPVTSLLNVIILYVTDVPL